LNQYVYPTFQRKNISIDGSNSHKSAAGAKKGQVVLESQGDHNLGMWWGVWPLLYPQLNVLITKEFSLKLHSQILYLLQY